jgi:hypothetical protein
MEYRIVALIEPDVRPLAAKLIQSAANLLSQSYQGVEIVSEIVIDEPSGPIFDGNYDYMILVVSPESLSPLINHYYRVEGFRTSEITRSGLAVSIQVSHDDSSFMYHAITVERSLSIGSLNAAASFLESQIGIAINEDLFAIQNLAKTSQSLAGVLIARALDGRLDLAPPARVPTKPSSPVEALYPEMKDRAFRLSNACGNRWHELRGGVDGLMV